MVRGSAGLFYDRVPLRALANALLSAGNTTDLGQLRQTNVSLSPAQAGAPVFPAILSAAVPSVTLFNLTTMDRDLQNAYSRQASVEVEQQLGSRATVSVAYQYSPARNLIMSVNQNVPSCVASGTNNGCRPNPAYGNNSQHYPWRTHHHGLHTVGPAPDTVGTSRQLFVEGDEQRGENFQLAIDPLPVEGLGPIHDDQRHRLVASRSINCR